MSHANSLHNEPVAANAKWLLWAGFMAILAAGVGFALRAGMLDNWQREYGFSATEGGQIMGMGLSGFCFGIIIGGVIADKIGYGKLVIAAFLFHMLSAFITFGAAVDVDATQQTQAYYALYWGSFLFAVANGTLEAVANPLIATLFPHNRTHYLNLLHASWPAGLILGSLLSWLLDDQLEWHWKLQLALYLIPVVIYGVMFLGQSMPKSEASKTGLSIGQMFSDVGFLGGALVSVFLAMFFAQSLGLGSAGYAIGIGVLLAMLLLTHTHSPRGDTIVPLGAFLLFSLFVAHALVGAVELGTETWLPNTTGNILTSEQGKILLVWTSFVMFALRFCANFIEKKIGISPIGILLLSSILACVGLVLTSHVDSFWAAMLALTVYGVGKTFFWPTMLAVGSDRYPRTGAIAISIMGGVGMLSAGLIGGPGLGYAKDRFTGEVLKAEDAAVYEEFTSESKPASFLFFSEVPAPAVANVQGKVTDARKILEEGGVEPLDEDELDEMTSVERKAVTEEYERKSAIEESLIEAGVLTKGEEGDPDDAVACLTDPERKAYLASIEGDRRMLRADAFIPAAMAVIYLLILLYFKSIGGYKVVHIDAGKGNGHG